MGATGKLSLPRANHEKAATHIWEAGTHKCIIKNEGAQCHFGKQVACVAGTQLTRWLQPWSDCVGDLPRGPVVRRCSRRTIVAELFQVKASAAQEPRGCR